MKQPNNSLAPSEDDHDEEEEEEEEEPDEEVQERHMFDLARHQALTAFLLSRMTGANVKWRLWWRLRRRL